MSTLSPLTDNLADDLANNLADNPADDLITSDGITDDDSVGEESTDEGVVLEFALTEDLTENLTEGFTESVEVEVMVASVSLPGIFATQNLPRTVAFARCPSIAEALLRYDVTDPILLARLTEARISAPLQLRCSDFPDPLLLLAVVDFDMPDVVGVLPIWQQMAHASPRAELRVIGYDEMPLLERILNGDSALDLDALDLPMLLLLDEEFQVQGQWGPRPQAAERYIEEWLGEHLDFERLAEDESDEGIAAFAALNLDLVRYMRVWYNSTLDKACSVELERLLASIQGEGGDGALLRQANDADTGDDSDADVE